MNERFRLRLLDRLWYLGSSILQRKVIGELGRLRFYQFRRVVQFLEDFDDREISFSSTNDSVEESDIHKVDSLRFRLR